LFSNFVFSFLFPQSRANHFFFASDLHSATSSVPSAFEGPSAVRTSGSCKVPKFLSFLWAGVQPRVWLTAGRWPLVFSSFRQKIEEAGREIPNNGIRQRPNRSPSPFFTLLQSTDHFRSSLSGPSVLPEAGCFPLPLLTPFLGIKLLKRCREVLAPFSSILCSTRSNKPFSQGNFLGPLLGGCLAGEANPDSLVLERSSMASPPPGSLNLCHFFFNTCILWVSVPAFVLT